MNNPESMIDAFMQPGFYPTPPKSIQHIQTHISNVFLVDEWVYKIKKAVNFGWVDFQSLSHRHKYCLEECRLNARFSPDIYWGVVPISLINERYLLDNDQNIVEYAVKMRLLRAEDMLENLLENNNLQLDQLNDLAEYLAEKHQSAPTAPVIYGTFEQIFQNAVENFTDLSSLSAGIIRENDLKKVEEISLSQIRNLQSIIIQRRAEGYIKDLHGDLHCSHICFTKAGVRLFDCIDFNPAFRCIDQAAEMAFLAMDLESRGRADLAIYLIERYQKLTRDQQLNNLIIMYKTYYALVRCKVHFFMSEDPKLNKDQKRPAVQQAQNYFNLALSYCLLKRPLLVITVGLTGSGKSTLSNSLCRQVPLIHLSSDAVRKFLFAQPQFNAQNSGFQKGIYQKTKTMQTYRALNQIAQVYLNQGHSVLLDATFSQKIHREAAAKIALEAKASFKIIEMQTPEKICLENLEKRLAKPSISDGRAEIYFKQKKTFEPLEDNSQHVIINQLPDYRTYRGIIDYLAA